MTSDHPTAERVRAVVRAGLCIGCGLCEALAPARWRMAMTAEGRLRPAPLVPEDPAADAPILAACPGRVAEAAPDPSAPVDPVWGAAHEMVEAWAGDPDIRFRAATGGVLTALGVHVLASGKARFVLQVGPDPAAPMRSRWVMSETPAEVVANAGSRYGPTAPLAGLEAALARGEPFAFIGKPCDAGALAARAKADPRIGALCVARLVMVCGGASELGKSEDVLREYGLDEAELTVFRYRGYGNPGRLRVETRDGRAFEKTYQELWADEGSWRIQTRCKLCPDAIGEAADIAAADIWPGGAPEGEDAGINGILVRTGRGQALVQAAVAAGDLMLGKALTARQFDDFQPHQVAKKRAMAARLRGLAAAGHPVYAHAGLRLEALDAGDAAEETGARERAERGRFTEPLPDVGEP